MKNVYTTFEIGRICHVYPTTVINWIKEGKLNSFSTPGGHRRVKGEDLEQFLKKYQFPMPPEFFRGSVGKKKILVVDDDLDMTALIKMVLETEKECWEISSVNTGFGAGAKVFEWQPDLILLDFLMPDLDGYEVCHLLRDNPKMKHVPIIAITALRTEKDRQKISDAGVTDYLGKPFRNKELIEKVKKHLFNEANLSHEGK